MREGRGRISSCSGIVCVYTVNVNVCAEMRVWVCNECVESPPPLPLHKPGFFFTDMIITIEFTVILMAYMYTVHAVTIEDY